MAFTDFQREEYWKAISILKSLIAGGISIADLLAEIEEDL